MPDSKQPEDVVTYANAVRAALAALPDTERESLLEDLEDHLAEVASESDIPLRERLGKPEDYANELRSAYGAGEAGATRRRRLVPQRLRAFISTVTATQAFREVRALLPELRPGWWVLRAYLAVLVLAFMLKDGKPLKDVLLYDQNGKPLLPAQSGLMTDYPIGADGQAITNSYPLNQRHPNGDPVLPPRVALPPFPTNAQSSPSPSPTP
jgi:hypothetical protein